MNNDNKKTFTDIFASATNNEEKQNEKTTFSSIVKEEPKKDNITLDKLLEQTKELNMFEIKDDNPENNTDPTSLKSSSIFETAINKSEENNNLKINFQEKSPSIQDIDISSNSNSSIFDNQKDNIQVNKNEKTSPEEKINNNISHDQLAPIENIFSEEPAKTEPSFEKNTTSDIFAKSPITFEPVTDNDEKSEENIIEENPFFKEKTSNEDNLEENNKQIPEIKTESNELETEKEYKERIPITFESVPSIEENPFFKEKASIEDNLEKNNKQIPEIKTESNELETEKEYKETSPFFSEEKKAEDSINNNPFFNNTINLVETKNQHQPAQETINLANTKHYNVKIQKKKEPLIKFILGVLSYAIFILLLLIGITLLIYVADIKIRASKGDYSPPKYNAYVVLTGSMLPEIQVYDVVLTKQIEASDLKEGDVITFASSDERFAGTIITHRIIKKNYDIENKTYTFQTKGDNNNVADTALVQANNIYGKVILKIPKLGYLQEFLATDGGWIIVILIPCLAVISYDIVKLAKGLKRKKYKNIKVQKK